MELKPPTQSDRRHGLNKVAEMVVSAIPGVGGPLGVALADRLTRSYNERMQDWLTDVAVALRQLEGRVGDFEDLATNEAFLDAVAAGTRIAERSRQEKRSILRNAVLNTALAVDPDEDRQYVFFDLIDRLPPVALRLLKFVADPRFREDVVGYKPPASGGEMVLIADIARLISPNPAPGEGSGALASFLNKQCTRLRDEELLSIGALSQTGYENDGEYFSQHVHLGQVTRFGRSFLNFIEDPRDTDGQSNSVQE
ncbi:hypothetical protein ACQP2X_41860 [Actinoplanes sp. CA-131856]